MGWRQKKSFCHLKQIKGLLNIDLNYASKQPAELRVNKKISDAPVTAHVPKIHDVEIINKKSFDYISWLIMLGVAALAAIIGRYLWLV